MSAEKLNKDNKQRLKDEDKRFDDIINVVENIKGNEREKEREFEIQDPMLNELSKGIDKNQAKMAKIDGKLSKLIASSSQTCLWFVIILEIIALAVCIVLLEKYDPV